MIDNQRFRNVVFYLKENKFIRNQQDFTERVGSDKATISQIMNDKINIPNNMFASVEVAFPFISSEWIKSGEGDMLKDSVVQTSRGNNSPNINGNGNHVQGTSALLDNALELQRAALTEISEMRKLLQEQVRNNQEQARSNQEQFNRLTNIIESLTRKD